MGVRDIPITPYSTFENLTSHNGSSSIWYCDPHPLSPQLPCSIGSNQYVGGTNTWYMTFGGPLYAIVLVDTIKLSNIRNVTYTWGFIGCHTDTRENGTISQIGSLVGEDRYVDNIPHCPLVSSKTHHTGTLEMGPNSAILLGIESKWIGGGIPDATTLVGEVSLELYLLQETSNSTASTSNLPESSSTVITTSPAPLHSTVSPLAASTSTAVDFSPDIAQSSQENKSKAVAIAAGVGSLCASLCLILVIGFFWWKRRREQRFWRDNQEFCRGSRSFFDDSGRRGWRKVFPPRIGVQHLPSTASVAPAIPLRQEAAQMNEPHQPHSGATSSSRDVAYSAEEVVLPRRDVLGEWARTYQTLVESQRYASPRYAG